MAVASFETADALLQPYPEQPEYDEAAAPSRLPFFVFCIYTFVLIGRPQEYVTALLPLRLALVLTVLTCVLTLLLRGGHVAARPFQHRETRLYALLFAAMCAGIPFAIYRPVTFDSVMLKYTVNVTFYFLFLVHVNTMERFKRVIVVLVLSAFVFGAMGMLRGEITEGRFRTGSEMFDPNDVAFMTVSLLAFVLCALLGSFGRATKGLALAALIVSVLLALYTGSRGGLIGLATLFVLFLGLRIPKVRRSHKALLVILLAAAVVGIYDKINIDRYLTLGNIGEDYNANDETGRLQIWTRGLQIVRSAPLTGVGVDGFGEAIGTVRESEGLLPVWQAPHNSYVQVFAETGVVGGGAFVFLIAVCLVTFNRLRRKSEPWNGVDLEAFPGILLIGLTAQVVGASFLSQAYSMPFTLQFAASAALTQIARTGSSPVAETEAA